MILIMFNEFRDLFDLYNRFHDDFTTSTLLLPHLTLATHNPDLTPSPFDSCNTQPRFDSLTPQSTSSTHALQIEEIHVGVVMTPDTVVQDVEILCRLGGESGHVFDPLKNLVHVDVVSAPDPRPGDGEGRNCEMGENGDWMKRERRVNWVT